jgi:ribosome-binding factor A
MHSEFKRADRVGGFIQAELSDIILRKTKDPRIGFVTITAVRVSDDLKHARVYISVMGSDAQKNDTLKGLRSAAHFMRGELGRRLRMKNTPELSFQLDESIERGARILEKLKELEGPEAGGAGEGGGGEEEDV